jgi:hypothetical protein
MKAMIKAYDFHITIENGRRFSEIRKMARLLGEVMGLS